MLSAATRLYERVAAAGCSQVEVFCKRSRSRTTRLEGSPAVSPRDSPAGSPTGSRPVRHEANSAEQGWAVRAGGEPGSFFAAATGPPEAAPSDWPPASGGPLRLRSEDAGAGAAAAPRPRSLDEPLLGPGETSTLLETIRRELQREAPGARLVRCVVEDGAAECCLVSSELEVREWRLRTAALLVEAALGDLMSRLYVAAPFARELRAQAVARRVASSLLLDREAGRFDRDRCEVVLAPQVGGRLLSLLWRELGQLARQGALSGVDPCVTLLEDARLDSGPLRAAYDGEGRRCGRTVLVRDGVLLDAAAALWPAPVGDRSDPGFPAGWSQRPSWRQPPTFAPTHLCIAPAPRTAPAALVGSVVRGIYLVRIDHVAPIPPSGSDPRQPSHRLLASGYEIRRGRAVRPVRAVGLEIGLAQLLEAVRAVGRDLELVPARAGCFGAPTLLLERMPLG
ncbi:MAG: hypothetical protein DWQ36_22970 [Acidobacteria bacterium]|mgnify:FL=1|nr:MAG: hypothetical protein DWQ36_22970 [Acidobacteriota bacterium]